MYAGPHRIVLHRNDQNLGLGGSLNEAMQRVTSELVVAAAGDDASLPERTRRIVDEYRQSLGRAHSICSAAVLVDEDGTPLRVLSPDTTTLTAEALARRYSTLLGATQAWHRDVFTVFGPYDARIRREDHIIPFRAALLGEIRAIQQPLVLYRSHSSNMSWRESGGWRGGLWYFGVFRRNAEESVLICHQRLADLALAQSRGLLRAEVLESLRAATNTRLREATVEVRITSCTLPSRGLPSCFEPWPVDAARESGLAGCFSMGCHGFGPGCTELDRRFRGGDSDTGGSLSDEGGLT